MDTDTTESGDDSNLFQMSKSAFVWMRREIPKAIREVGPLRIGIGIGNWVVIVLFLTAFYQAFGILGAIGMYVLALVVFGIIEAVFIPRRTLTHRPEYIRPMIDQDIVSNTEKTITVTGDTDTTVILGLAGEENIANYHDTHREIETGEEVTLTKSEDSITIETPTETETVNIKDTSVDLFKHDFILLEYYEKTTTLDDHIHYGDI